VKPTVTPAQFSSIQQKLVSPTRLEDLETLGKSWKVLRGQESLEKESSGQEKLLFSSHSSTSAIFNTLGISVSCKKGMKPSPHNQDDFSIIYSKGVLFVSVFDGHGVYGNEISNYLHIVLPNLIITHPSFPAEIESILRESFFKCNIYLHQYCETASKSAELSGSTCTILLLHNKDLYVCNIGDSKAIFIDHLTTVHKLTIDHKPGDSKELERILKSGGEVKRLDNESTFRIFAKGQRLPGISVSRAFGDSIAQTIGVTVSPDISKRTLDQEDQFLVVCSDGVWEFLTDLNVMDVVIRASSPASELTETAWKKWLEIEGDSADDITAVVINLKEFFKV
jgi:serine/threonine protein phosphatase PrpC